MDTDVDPGHVAVVSFAYAVLIAGSVLLWGLGWVVVAVLYLLWRFVRAHERIVDASGVGGLSRSSDEGPIDDRTSAEAPSDDRTTEDEPDDARASDDERTEVAADPGPRRRPFDPTTVFHGQPVGRSPGARGSLKFRSTLHKI